ncbi:MAG: hypothetical protein JWO38_1354 [Gemmataceae bacterium]|nr:hypothetical protein [Gemmataceae bacterium]
MSDVRSTDRRSMFGRASEDWREQSAPALRSDGGRLVPGWLVVGVAAAGLGYLAWRHFGADFQRYLKMRNM